MSKRNIELDKEYNLLLQERTALNERYEKLLSRFEIIGHVSDKYNYSDFFVVFISGKDLFLS